MGFCKSLTFTALLWVLVAPAVQAADSPTCVLTRLVNIEMKLDRSGRPIIPVTINGVPKWALIDTGGAFSSMTDTAVKDLKLKTALYPKHNIYFINGKSPSEMAFTDRFVAGQLNLAHASNGLYFAVDEPPHASDEFDATLSADILHLFDVELDFGARTFQLFLQTTCGENVVHWTNDEPAVVPFETNKVDWVIEQQQMVGTGVGATSSDPGTTITPNSRTTNKMIKVPEWNMIARGRLDGVDVDVIINTGSPTSTIIAEDAKDVMASRPSGTQDDPARPFKKLTIGSLTVDDPQIVIQNVKLTRTETIGRVRPQVVLGATVLRRLHFYIAYKDEKIYLTEAKPH
jgi:hypothetical protein